MYGLTGSTHVRKILASEMVSHVFTNILRSQLNSILATFPSDEFEALNVPIANQILLDCLHAMINEFFSYSTKSEAIWKIVVRQVKQIYNIALSKEDIIPGFLLASIMDRNGIECDYKTPELKRNSKFFVKENLIPKSLLVGFFVRERMYNLESISP